MGVTFTLTRLEMMSMRQISRLWLLVLLLGAGAMTTMASDRQQVYEAYVKRDITAWQRIIDRINSEPNKSYARLAELIEYEYGYVAECILLDRDNEAERCLKRYKAHVEYLLESNYQEAKMTAYLSAYYGYRIGISWLRAPLVGNRCLKLMNRSIAMDKQNVIGLIQRGNAQFFAPAFFKGDAKRGAVNYLLRAERAMVSQGESQGSWLYLNLLIQIAECYVGIDEQQQAEVWYRKAMSIEPRLSWALDEKYLERKQSHGQQD